MTIYARFFMFTTWIFLLSGCAATTAMSLISPVGTGDPEVPSPTTVQSELKGRAFDMGLVYMDRSSDAPKGTLELPDEAYIRLLHHQLKKAFSAGRLNQGTQPAYTVNAAIEVTKFTEGRAVIPDPSIFWVRVEMLRPDRSIVMRGRLKTGDVILEGVPVILPRGIVTVPMPVRGADLAAVATTFPAMAVTIAQVAQGLQQGKTLDAIELFPYPDRFSAIPARRTLKENKLGITEMDFREMAEIILSVPGQ